MAGASYTAANETDPSGQESASVLAGCARAAVDAGAPARNATPATPRIAAVRSAGGAATRPSGFATTTGEHCTW